MRFPRDFKTKTSKSTTSSSITMARLRVGLFLASAVVVAQLLLAANCEAKEFDWSELGVSLGGSKPAISAGAGNNLRIVVSPQRRMTKNYDFDYNATSSQTAHSAQGETSYVIPTSGGNPTYLTQSVSQLPSHSGHSSAYSALSASLASLKNRLSARGVALSGSLAESNVSSLYPSSVSSYGSPLMLDSQQASQTQPQVQPTYLSVSNQQEQQANTYSGSHSSGSDNKTIVLAIPAKINFLTDGRSAAAKQQQQQQQPQQPQPQQILPSQLTVLQPTGDPSGRAEYAPKVIGSSDGSVDQNGHVVSQSGGSDQEHHQYVIVNSPPQAGDHSHIVTTNSGQIHQQTPIYSNVYPTVQQGLGTFSMKYIPAYQQAAIQQPTVQKVYSSIETTGPVEPADQSNRYPSCLDTCNSADPRWRKYTVSKYKYCCSRSPQYDPQFDTPSAEKVGESSSKYSEDSYYNYLYRRTRARRSRKSRNSRQHRYSSAGSSSPAEDESAEANHDANRPSSVRTYNESPYMKYYKSRSQQPPVETADAPRDPTDQTSQAGPGKHASKERSHRRSRGRDFDVPESQPVHDSNEEENVYNQRETTRGEYSADGPPRYREPSDSRAVPIEDEDSRANFDDAAEQDVGKTGVEGSDYSGADQLADSQFDEPEPETSGNSNFSNKYSLPRRRKQGRPGSRPRRPAQSGKDSKYYKKSSRKPARYNSKSEHPSSSQTNGTDYDSAQAGDQNHSDQYNEDDPSYQKDTTGTEGSGESDSINKYKQGLNESTVAHLSKTTMHLKEILSLLEKKAQLRANESVTGQPSTSTPAPTTTTSIYNSPLFSSAFSSASLPSSFSSDYLSSELGLKSPYRLEPPSLASSLNSPSLSLPSSYGSLASDAYSSLPGYGSSHYGSLGQIKHLPIPNHPRKKRVNKNLRYNNLMLPKNGPLGSSASLLHAASKSALLGNPYYSSLQYPYWYTRGSSPSVTNSYPYKNIHRPSYLNGPVSSKLAAAAAASSSLYSDEARYHGLQGYDPIANVASSLRPSTTMRLRTKPFVLQPQVLPIYSRHNILGPNMDVKK